MTNDEQAIRAWYDDWIRSTTVGDLGLAKSLIADDAVFLMPGAGEMDGDSYAAGMTGSDPSTDFALDSKIREIRVFGDHAMLWSEFSLVSTKKDTGAQSKVAGHALSVLERTGDGWAVIRDANTMASAPLD